MTAACIVATLILALVMTMIAVLGVAAAVAESSLYDTHDFRRAIWEEREARRILRARYARGLVDVEEYRRLCLELERGQDA